MTAGFSHIFPAQQQLGEIVGGPEGPAAGTRLAE
jgi:hypothetical protein